MKIMVLDNYDSFTYNLVHYLEDLLNQSIPVFRNDKFRIEDVDYYDSIVLSPGPGLPKSAGNLIPLIKKFYQTKKILGVCLGHQAIAEAFGSKLKQINEVLHGINQKTLIVERDDPVFNHIPTAFDCGRYHSWVIDKATLPNELEIIATDHNDEIMAIKHQSAPLYGVQFHPESIMTTHGKQLLYNWLNI